MSDEFLAKLEDAILEKIKDANLKETAQFIVEEALYIALMADLFLVSGRIRAFEEDGLSPTPLGAERLVIAEVVKGIHEATEIEIPLTNKRPFGWATQLTKAWEAAFRAEEEIDGVVFYKAIPTHMRMFITLGLPGMLRIAVQLTRQLIQLAT